MAEQEAPGSGDCTSDFCVVCRRRRRIGDGISFFTFPRGNPDLMQAWLASLNLPATHAPQPRHRVCMEHFDKQGIFPRRPGQMRRLLKANAVPILPSTSFTPSAAGSGDDLSTCTPSTSFTPSASGSGDDLSTCTPNMRRDETRFRRASVQCNLYIKPTKNAFTQCLNDRKEAVNKSSQTECPPLCISKEVQTCAGIQDAEGPLTSTPKRNKAPDLAMSLVTVKTEVDEDITAEVKTEVKEEEEEITTEETWMTQVKEEPPEEESPAFEMVAVKMEEPDDPKQAVADTRGDESGAFVDTKEENVQQETSSDSGEESFIGQGKALNSQAQQMVVAALEFCKAERDLKGPIIPFESVNERAAAILKSSENIADKKRKKMILSIQQKCEALKRLDKGESLRNVATDLGVGQVTISDWKKRKGDLEKGCIERDSNEGLKDRKTKRCEYEKVSEGLYLWYTQQRNKGTLLTDKILQEKALFFQKELNEGESYFTASVGWLDGWKKRYGIRQLNISSEKLSQNCEEFVKFKSKLRSYVIEEGLSSDQLYAFYETGLNCKVLPSAILRYQAQTLPLDYHQGKERVTILGCSNANGSHQLKLTLIGKDKCQEALETLNPTLPVSYQYQKDGCVDRQIFQRWFFMEFVPSVTHFLRSLSLPRNAILLLENASYLPEEGLLCSRNIRIMLIPSNVAACCRMDRDVVETLKIKYRHKLLTALVQERDFVCGILGKLRNVSLREIFFWIAQSWERIEPRVLARSWRPLLLDGTVVLDIARENCDNLLLLLQQVLGCENVSVRDIQEWMEKDKKQELTDLDIIALVNRSVNEDDADVGLGQDKETNENGKRMVCGEEVRRDNVKRINHSEGLKALEAALAYIAQQEEATPDDVILFTQWRNLAESKKSKAKETHK